MSAKKKQVGPSNLDVRANLEDDVEAFLKKGNKIQQIPSGVSGQVSVSAKKATAADKKTS
jgi:cytochrome c551/c552